MASEERKAQTTQRWSSSDRALITETNHPLEAGLKDAAILLNAGRITVQGVKDGSSNLVTRLIISASSEAEAKKHLETWEDKLKVQERAGQLVVDGRDEETAGQGGGTTIISGRGSVVIGGSFSGGIISTGGGGVWINGRRVDTEGVVNVPSVRREVTLNVPAEDQMRYALQVQSGSVNVRDTQGLAKASGSTAEINVVSFKGVIEADTQTGSITLERVEGELSADNQSGDINGESFKGRAQASTMSGDITFNDSEFTNGRSVLKTMSGSVSARVTNKSLRVSASTRSGRVRVPQGDFTVDRDNRNQDRGFDSGTVVIGDLRGGISVNIGGRGGGQSIEGHFGSSTTADSLNLTSMSGNVSVSR